MKYRPGPAQIIVIEHWFTAFLLYRPIKNNPFDVYSNRFLSKIDSILKKFDENSIDIRPNQYIWILVSMKKELSLKGNFYSY